MKRVYTFYKDSHPGQAIVELIVEETLTSKTGSINILNEGLTPVEIKMVAEFNNNLNGVDEILQDRVTPSGRMWFEEFCKERQLNPKDIDDRLTLSKGRSMSDDYFVEIEQSGEL